MIIVQCEWPRPFALLMQHWSIRLQSRCLAFVWSLRVNLWLMSQHILMFGYCGLSWVVTCQLGPSRIIRCKLLLPQTEVLALDHDGQTKMLIQAFKHTLELQDHRLFILVQWQCSDLFCNLCSNSAVSNSWTFPGSCYLYCKCLSAEVDLTFPRFGAIVALKFATSSKKWVQQLNALKNSRWSYTGMSL